MTHTTSGPPVDERTNKIPKMSKIIILKLKNDIESPYNVSVCPKALLVRMSYDDLSDITLST